MIRLPVLTAAATIVAGHFSIVYPSWQANTLSGGTNYSQWIWPCELAIFFLARWRSRR